MITGEHLVCDELGPLGRLVPPGKVLVMDPPGMEEEEQGLSATDLLVVKAERRWVAQQYERAEAEAEAFRRALRTAHLGGEEKRERVREWFEIWTLEATKFALCDTWLLQVIGKLESGQQMVMNVPADFSWDGYGPIRKMKERLFAAGDGEIVQGARFRA